MSITSEKQAIVEVREYFTGGKNENDKTKLLNDVFEFIRTKKMNKRKSYTKGFMNVCIYLSKRNQWQFASTRKLNEKLDVQKLCGCNLDQVRYYSEIEPKHAKAASNKLFDCGDEASFPGAGSTPIRAEILIRLLKTVGIHLKSGFPYACVRDLSRHGYKIDS